MHCRLCIRIYGPMIYMALYVMLLMRANQLQGQVGGVWALESKTFLDPEKWYPVMDLPASKALRTEPYQSEVHR